jgi:DNA-binding CsgD family transcriptional regulator
VSWDQLSVELQTVIDDVCTPRQVEAVKLAAAGMSPGPIAMALDIDRKSARELLARAYRKIQTRTPTLRAPP